MTQKKNIWEYKRRIVSRPQAFCLGSQASFSTRKSSCSEIWSLFWPTVKPVTSHKCRSQILKISQNSRKYKSLSPRLKFISKIWGSATLQSSSGSYIVLHTSIFSVFLFWSFSPSSYLSSSLSADMFLCSILLFHYFILPTPKPLLPKVRW